MPKRYLQRAFWKRLARLAAPFAALLLLIAGTGSMTGCGDDSSSGGSQGGQGGQGSGMQGCADASGCPGVDHECQTRTCNNGQCGFNFAPNGAALASQTAGDCKTDVCNGMGWVTSVNDDADVPGDGNACTVDSCNSGTPTNLPTPSATPCSDGTGKLCDGSGACVECLLASDCSSSVCINNKCIAVSCTNGVKDGGETDVDCGGKDCSACGDLKGCVESADCKSAVCVNNLCQSPTCADRKKNGAEADIDCGGPTCSACDPGKLCSGPADCTSKLCSAGVCTTPGCADGVNLPPEQCDDGNTTNGDGCNAACATELGWTCEGQPSACATTCGDGIVAESEECDDGNKTGNDGCSITCKVEPGWSCTQQTPASPSVCATICGDGIPIFPEQCDDGNTTNGDGCAAACATELGWTCEGQPSACATTCGDGIVAEGEKCDDGNKTGNDGCSITCKVEPGWSCSQQTPASPSACAATCGDGFPVGPEQCDDGNTTSGDGCSTSCQTEPGYICVAIPSTCIATCGDGLVVGPEQCDDGNTVNNDGCSTICEIQAGWSCTSLPGTPTVCDSVCGDSIVVGAESCDDGNTDDNDCCSAACQPELVCEIEPNDDAGLANDFDALSAFGSIKGRINPPGESDYYSLRVPPLTTFALIAETTDGPHSGCVSMAQDSSIVVYDESGTQLGTDDNSGDGNCALLAVGGLRGGQSGADYYVEVTGSSSVNLFDYTLELFTEITICGNGVKELGEQCDDNNALSGDGCSDLCLYESLNELEPNNTAGEANGNGSYLLNFLWFGSITSSTDLDFYRLDLVTTTDLTIQTFDSTGPSSCVSPINNKLELRAANGTTVLAADSDDGVNSCALINATNDVGVRHLPSGVYYIVVQNQLTTTSVPAPYAVLATATALCGDGKVEGAEQCDSTSNCDANCDVIPTCGDGFLSAGEQCDDHNLANGDGCDSACQFELFTEIEPNNTVAQADALPLVSGDVMLTGAIGAVGDKDFFKLNVAALSVIRFESFETMVPLDCPAIATTLRLFDSAGVQLKVDSTTDASGIKSCGALILRLTPGSYYIQIEKTSNNAAIPAYFLQVKFEADLGSEAEPNDLQTQATALGGADVFVFGNHQVAADLDYFAITVPSGKSIRAEVLEGDASKTCESNTMDSFLTLFNGAGGSLVTDSDDGRGFCSVIDGTGATPRDTAARNLLGGTYLLQVKGQGAAAGQVFNYNLAITVR